MPGEREKQHCVSRKITGDEKEDIVWQNIEGDRVFYDSAGNPMDASRKERFYGEALGQEEVREIHFAPDIEEKRAEDKQRLGEATRDTITETYDGQSVNFGYEIYDNVHGSQDLDAAGVGVEEADVGVDPAEVFDNQTTAKVTMYGESKDVNEPGIDPEDLGEKFERQFRQARRDPWLDPRLEMSEEYKQEMGYTQQYTRG